MLVRIWGAAVLTLAFAIVLPNVATAEETAQQKADRLFAEGRDLAAKKEWQAACDKFEQAITLDVTATGTMLNLGLCYENLGKFAKSLVWFRKAQAAASEGKLTDYENAAKEHTYANSLKVPTISIAITGAMDAEIRIDGGKIEPTSYGRIELDPGEHEIVGRTAGKKKVTQKITLQEPKNPNDIVPVEIKFLEAAVPEYVDHGKGTKRVGLILGGAGVVTLIGVGIYGFIAKARYEDLSNTDAEAEKARDNLRTYGTGAFLVGIGAVTAGMIVYLTAPGKEQVSDGTAFAPTISPDEVGFAVSGRF